MEIIGLILIISIFISILRFSIRNDKEPSELNKVISAMVKEEFIEYLNNTAAKKTKANKAIFEKVKKRLRQRGRGY
jgi:hypothetical protein